MVVLEPGETIDRYTIQASLGAGGMGHVYRAHDTRLHRSVALKVLHVAGGPGSGPASTAGAARMLREARAVAALDHPNVVAIYDVGEAQEPEKHRGTAYLAMELIKGKSLRAYVGGNIAMDERIRWLADVARALAVAHQRGLVHRDIKPENVMIRDDGVVKVLDFGIAKRSHVPVDPSAPTEGHAPIGVTTTQGVAIGTPYYMAPEQMRGEDLDGRADQFSWAVMAYELLGGKPPWRTDGEALHLVAEVLSKDPDPLSERTEVPPRVAAVVMRALAKARTARYESMDALLLAMQSDADAFAPTESRIPVASGSAVSGATAIATSPTATTKRSVPPAKSDDTTRPSSTSRSLAVALVGALVLVGAAATIIGVAGKRFAASASAPEAASLAAPASRECASNRDCMRAHGEQPWRCKLPAGVCAPLASEDCVVLAEKADLENDATVWIGTMFPVSGEEGKAYGLSNQQAVDLGRRDFAESLGRFAQTDPRTIRPIGVVACNDVVDASRAAQHLVGDVEPVGVIGFRSSTEIVDLAASVFIPRRVTAIASLNTGADVTAVPQPSGEPRLVWRTTYNLNATAAPLSAFVRDVLEPRVRAAPLRPTVESIRVAFVRPRTKGAVALSAELLRTLTFNGVSATANRDTYLEIVNEDPRGKGGAPDWESTLRQLKTFAPHVVLFQGDDALIQNVIAPLEASWPLHAARPIYATMNGLAPAVFPLIGKDASRRRRFFGITSVSTIDTNAKFVTHYNETYPDKITRTIAPNTSYDAFYLLAYAVHALGENAPTGPNVARAFSRLVPPGKPADVGPADIFDAYKSLAAGKSLDLNGSIGKLDFDVDVGEAPVDMAILCVNIDHDGRAFDTMESGLVYDAAAKKLVGAMRCP